MKKILSLLLPLVYFLTPSFAFADTTVQACPPNEPFKTLCNYNIGSFGGLVGTAITILFIIAIVIALIFLVYGGIRWILSGGDKSAVEGARNTIIAAVVGLVIVFLAYFILNLILGFFGISINNLVFPTFKPTVSTDSTSSLTTPDFKK